MIFCLFWIDKYRVNFMSTVVITKKHTCVCLWIIIKLRHFLNSVASATHSLCFVNDVNNIQWHTMFFPSTFTYMEIV